jgi:hypothetical protein
MLPLYWAATSTPDSPTGWITQAGLGAVVMFMGVAIRWLVKRLEAEQQRVYDLLQTVLPVLTKIDENMRMQAELQRADIESTNRHTSAIEAWTERMGGDSPRTTRERR